VDKLFKEMLSVKDVRGVLLIADTGKLSRSPAARPSCTEPLPKGKRMSP